MRRLPVPRTLLLIVVVLSAVALVPAAMGALPGAVEAVTPDDETVSQLSLPAESGLEEQQTVDASLSSALTVERAQVETNVDSSAFETRFDAAANRSERVDTARTAITNLHSQGEALRENRTEAVRAFNRGDRTTTELLRTLARIETAASGVESRAETIETVTQQRDFSMPADLSARLSSLDAELVSLQGPVLERIAAASTGARTPSRIGLATANSGLVLATIESDNFHREATLWTARAEDGPNLFAENESSPLVSTHQQAQAVYPWAFDNLVSNPSISGLGDSTIYPVRLNHAQGELNTYFDGRSTDVFYEQQRLRLSSLPTRTVATNETDSLAIRVNETGEGRPLSVTVTDPSSNTTTNATISADNETVGTTDDAGQLWMLSTTDDLRITATAEEESVSVTLGE